VRPLSTEEIARLLRRDHGDVPGMIAGAVPARRAFAEERAPAQGLVSADAARCAAVAGSRMAAKTGGRRAGLVALPLLCAQGLSQKGRHGGVDRGGIECRERHAKAPALEAYPLDADLTPSASGTGYASTFARAGFKTVVRRVPPRPIMRHDLNAAGASYAPQK